MSIPNKRCIDEYDLMSSINVSFEADVDNISQAIMALSYVAGFISVEEIVCLLGVNVKKIKMPISRLKKAQSQILCDG